jgi:hypothetical protein
VSAEISQYLFCFDFFGSHGCHLHEFKVLCEFIRVTVVFCEADAGE